MSDADTYTVLEAIENRWKNYGNPARTDSTVTVQESDLLTLSAELYGTGLTLTGVTNCFDS